METKTKELTFNIGEETRPIALTKDNYKGDLLEIQIDKGLSLIDSYISSNNGGNHNESDRHAYVTCNNQIISFLGDRGSGKSSCMYSLLNIIREDSASKIFVLDVIDPVFFDNKRNILEIVIGTMFKSYSDRREKEQSAENYHDLDKLSREFQMVKQNLAFSEKSCYEEDSELEDLQGLASSIRLSESMQKLVRSFLDIEKKDYLLISIDDIDLNASKAYQMAEQIRKYLTMKEVIICIAGKLEQLADVVKQNFMTVNETLLRQNQVTLEEISEMTEAYLTKFLPIHTRIFMPSFDDYSDKRLIINKNGEEKTFDSVKIAVLELIFRKTRFLFYNPKGQYSLIIPSNLRELRALILLLYNMPEYVRNATAEKDIKNNKENKSTFLKYFYSRWTNCLTVEDKKIVQELIDEKEPSMFNSIVINTLKEKYKLKESQNANLPDWDIILNGNCTNYNLSIGDADVVMNQIINTHTDIETRRLIFFIKSLYSIRLYQYYDDLTDALYIGPGEHDVNNDKPELLHNFLEGVSSLQQLIGGSYYTISGKQLIRPSLNPDVNREKGLLDGGELKRLIDDIVNRAARGNLIIEDEEGLKLLNIAEFLMLISSHYLYSKSKFLDSYSEEKGATYRQRPEVFYKRNLSDVKNINYDVTAPFFNLLDIDNAYGRFNKDIAGIAKKSKGSLYYKMVEACKKDEREVMPEHSYLSSACIRNMEICEDLFQEMLLKRDKCDSTSLVKHLQAFYSTIAEYKIKTYDYDSTGHRYDISFKPFKVIRDFLQMLGDDVLNAYMQNAVKEPVQNEKFSFINKRGMTFTGLWKAIPDEMKVNNSRKKFEEIFILKDRHIYSKEEIIANLQKMINDGMLKDIE